MFIMQNHILNKPNQFYSIFFSVDIKDCGLNDNIKILLKKLTLVKTN